MFRGVFALVTVVSCLACAAFCAVWARTYWFADSVEWVSSGQSALVTTMPGHVRISWPSPYMRINPSKDGGWFSSVKRDGRSDIEPESPSFERKTFSFGTSTIDYIKFPLWALVAAAAVLPVSRWSVVAIRARRRRRFGLCRLCGYDLRASPERCPECGLAPGRSSPRTFPRMLTTALVVATAGGLAWAAQSDVLSKDCVRVDFQTLGGFPFDEDKGVLADIPPPIRSLDGRRVEVDGVLIPMDSSDHITCFALISRLWSRWGPHPRIHEVVVVRLEAGRWIDYTLNRIRVRGVLRVRVQSEDGYNVSVYEMTADSVEVVGPP